MSVFHDKTYEGMDWLSRAIEPYSSYMNKVLADLPAEHELSAAEVLSTISDSYSEMVTASGAFRVAFGNKDIYSMTDYRTIDFIEKSFELVFSPEIEIDAKAVTMIGSIKLVKTREVFDDHDIKKMMAANRVVTVQSSDCSNEAIHDLGALMFEPNHRFHKASQKKDRFLEIKQYLNKAAEEDHFKIRDHEAFNKFMKMICKYLCDNDQNKLGKIYRTITMAKRGIVSYEVETA